MNRFQRFILASVMGLLLLVVCVKAHAATVSQSCPYNTYTNVLLSGPAKTTSIVFANGTGTNTFVALFDNSSTNLTWTNGAYAYTHYASQSVTNIYTNYFGVLTTNTYTALVGTSNYVASATSNYAPVLSVDVPANTTTVLNGTFRFLSGIQVTNGLGQTTVTVNYQ